MLNRKKHWYLAVMLMLGVVPYAYATNGDFSHGYGMKAKGMGGVGVALPQDAIAAATNPAGMVMVGGRMDLGVDWFRPIRSAEITGNATPANNISYDGSKKKDFFIPEFGYNKMLGTDMSIGVSMFGNGGMNTSYTRNVTLFSNDNSAGVDFAQLIVAPTIAWRFSDVNAVGVSLDFAYQRFKATGLQNFDNPQQSHSPGNVTDNGYDNSYGIGLRLGWTGTVSPDWTFGATYQPKTSMSKFDKYKGLFAEGGKFDIPSNAALGVAYKGIPKTVVAFDVERIYYTDSKSIHDPLGSVNGGGILQNTLGTDNGAGFGWDNIMVYKLGVSVEVNNNLTIRAGWNHNDQPIPTSQTFFNLLAPGVVQDRLTLGATWGVSQNSELTIAYMHAFEKKVNGSNSIPSAFGGGEANLKMYEDSLGVAYSWKM